jgi:hypothetical protein
VASKVHADADKVGSESAFLHRIFTLHFTPHFYTAFLRIFIPLRVTLRVLLPSTMANIIRSAKSGSDWTTNELLAYNITVDPLSSRDFFGFQPSSTLNQLDPKFVSGTLQSEGLSDHTYRLFQYLDLATNANAGQESAIDDFAKEILRVIGFEERGTLLRSRFAIPLTICGDSKRAAQTDVCLVHGNSTILLVVQEDKTTISNRDPEAQVIAQAIAAFQYNNRVRSRIGLRELEGMDIPCITVVGTRPIFYIVPVTRALSNAVITAQYPLTTYAEIYAP